MIRSLLITLLILGTTVAEAQTPELAPEPALKSGSGAQPEILMSPNEIIEMGYPKARIASMLAVHEAGHALVAAKTGRCRVERISFQLQGMTLDAKTGRRGVLIDGQTRYSCNWPSQTMEDHLAKLWYRLANLQAGLAAQLYDDDGKGNRIASTDGAQDLRDALETAAAIQGGIIFLNRDQKAVTPESALKTCPWDAAAATQAVGDRQSIVLTVWSDLEDPTPAAILQAGLNRAYAVIDGDAVKFQVLYETLLDKREMTEKELERLLPY